MDWVYPLPGTSSTMQYQQTIWVLQYSVLWGAWNVGPFDAAFGEQELAKVWQFMRESHKFASAGSIRAISEEEAFRTISGTVKSSCFFGASTFSRASTSPLCDGAESIWTFF